MGDLGLGVRVNVPEDVTRDTAKFLTRIVGPLAEIGDPFSEKIRFLRYRSAIKTLNRAAGIAKNANMKVKKLPIKFLVPFIEDCSLEEEESPLIEQWASACVSFRRIRSVTCCGQGRAQKYFGQRGGAFAIFVERNRSRLFKDNISSYQIVEHIGVNINGAVEHYTPKIKIAMPESDLDILIRELVRLPVVPLFYHIPHLPGVTKTVETNYSTVDKGSVFLLERLEILKAQEVRLKLSRDEQIADFVMSYAQLTAFGVEVFLQCGGLSRGKKRKQTKKETI